MIEAHYPLQALLYDVALHRYLRWRQPGYDPDVHLGGSLYLFLRGMSGPVRPAGRHVPGVFAWRPPAALVIEVSDLLAGATMTAPPEVAPRADGPCGAPPGCCATSTRPGVLTAADVHVATGWASWAARRTRRSCSPPRWWCGRPGTARWCSTWRTRATPGSSTTWRASRRPAPWRRPDPPWPAGRVGRAVRRQPARRRAAPRSAPGQPAVAGPVLGAGAAGRRRAAGPLARAGLTTSTWACCGQPRPAVRRRRDDDPDQRTGRGGLRADAGQRAGRRPGHRQDHHGRAAARGCCASRTPRCRIALAAPTGKAAARLEEAVRSSTPPCSAATASGSVSCRPSRCTGCSAGGRGRAAGSGTTATTGCPTRWWSSTRARWCR